MDPLDLRMRFFASMNGLTREMAARLTQIDYARELALVALSTGTDEGLGVARILADPDNAKAEFAVIVRSDWKGRGLGHLLISRLIEIARERGIGALEGSILRENIDMVNLCAHLGFSLSPTIEDPAIMRAKFAL